MTAADMKDMLGELAIEPHAPRVKKQKVIEKRPGRRQISTSNATHVDFSQKGCLENCLPCSVKELLRSLSSTPKQKNAQSFRHDRKSVLG